jgi:hypothetical protein
MGFYGLQKEDTWKNLPLQILVRGDEEASLPKDMFFLKPGQSLKDICIHPN